MKIIRRENSLCIFTCYRNYDIERDFVFPGMICVNERLPILGKAQKHRIVSEEFISEKQKVPVFPCFFQTF